MRGPTYDDKEAFNQAVEKAMKTIATDKKKAQKFLVELGLFTKKGRLRKPYRELSCILQKPD